MKRYFAAILVACALGDTCFAQPAGAEISPPSETHNAQSTLPRCMDSSTDLAQIQDAQKANAKTSLKYDGYRNVLHTATDLELAARLAYAETLATNCPDDQSRVMDLVTSVIGNRIRIRHGDVRSVVLQRDQFASSLNLYPESRYRDFLCPNDGELWSRTLAKMQANLENPKPSAHLPNDAVNYYLYRHSDRLKAPDWKLEEATIRDERLRECIRVFRNPAWK